MGPEQYPLMICSVCTEGSVLRIDYARLVQHSRPVFILSDRSQCEVGRATSAVAVGDGRSVRPIFK